MSVTDPEHDFGEEVIKVGDKQRGFTASEALEAHEPVEVTGDYEVSAATAGRPFFGVATHDAVDGQEITLAGPDCEAFVEASEAISPGDSVTPDGLGAFEVATSGDDAVGVALTTGAPGELFVIDIQANSGNLGA